MTKSLQHGVLAGSVLFALMGAVAFGADGDSGKGGLYGQKIVIATNADKSVNVFAVELADYLKQITGAPFAVTNAEPDAGQGGIAFLNVNSPLVAEADRARLKDQGLEAFILHGDSAKLQIIGNDWRGLRHGAYFYLEQLGVRWLLAGKNWTAVPERSDVTLTINRLAVPAFFARTYGGTGGFYSCVFGRNYTGSAATRAKGVAEFQNEWTLWAQHMRNGGQALGHAMGEGFVMQNEAVLQAHPEYLAKIDGKFSPLYLPTKRQEFANYVWNAASNRYVKAAKPGTGTHELNIIAKLNAGNPEAVKFWCDWILKRLRADRSGPQGYAVRTISVEPSDGTGEGNNYDELKAQGIGDGSESDQEFYIANYCAREIRKEFPDVSVVMLAYVSRSDPPTFPLEPNFIVQPAFAFRYGRKTASLNNEEWLTVWAAKAKNMAVYDYWSIPDWSHDEPTFNYLEVAKKLRDYYSRNIKGLNAESTFSGGAMGIGQYLASHLMWDINLDEEALLEDWYDNAFGLAKAPMKRMLERWARGYCPISSELGLSYHDIGEAARLAAGHPAVLARVDDYARYLHFLRLYDQLLNSHADKDKQAIVLREHLFDINESRMVHTTRIFDLQRTPASVAEFHLRKVNDPKDEEPDGPGWARVHALTHAEVAALIADGASKYPPPDFTMKSFTGKLVPLQPIVWKAPQGDPWGVIVPAAVTTVDLEMPQGLAAFPLRVSRAEDNKVTVTDNAGHTVYTHTVTEATAKDWDELSIPLAPGHYHVNFAGKGKRNGLFSFQTWKGMPLILRTLQNQKGAPSPRLYFYVPRGLQKIAFYFPCTDHACAYPTPVYYPNGAPARVEDRDDGKLMIVPVPDGMDGKVWSLDRLVQPYFDFETLNSPQTFSLEPQVLMVPGDAL